MKKKYTLILVITLFIATLTFAQTGCNTGLGNGGSSSTNLFSHPISQSFQVSCTGKLTTIVFTPTNAGNSNIDIITPGDGVNTSLRLLNASNTVIANATIGGVSSINTWQAGNTYTFDFSVANITLDANTTYKWELYNDQGFGVVYLAFTNLTDPYPLGNATAGGFDYSTGDFHNWTVNVDTSLSTSSFDKELVKIYPNPSTGIFTIVNENIIKIEVYDLVGKLILKQENEFGVSSFDLNQYPAGIYLIKILNKNNQSNTIKLIKN